MSNTLLGNINVEDVPAPEVKKRKAIATIGRVQTNPIANGYVQVVVPLKYEDGGQQRTFTARWNVRPEWFSPQFTEQIRAGQIEGKEKTQYDINFSGLTRGIFKATGITGAMDFSRLENLQVGFATRVGKDSDGEPREQIGSFFPASRGLGKTSTPQSSGTPQSEL